MQLKNKLIKQFKKKKKTTKKQTNKKRIYNYGDFKLKH